MARRPYGHTAMRQYRDTGRNTKGMGSHPLCRCWHSGVSTARGGLPPKIRATACDWVSVVCRTPGWGFLPPIYHTRDTCDACDTRDTCDACDTCDTAIRPYGHTAVEYGHTAIRQCRNAAIRQCGNTAMRQYGFPSFQQIHTEFGASAKSHQTGFLA